MVELLRAIPLPVNFLSDAAIRSVILVYNEDQNLEQLNLWR